MPCATQEPTPSGQLSDPFNKMCLASQAMTQAPRPSQRPPVPLFSQAAPQPSQTRAAEYGDGGDLPCSQLDYLATPDFITPADQFGGMENDPNAVVKHQRSPVQLSPNRIKRARRNAVEGMVVGGCATKLNRAMRFVCINNIT